MIYNQWIPLIPEETRPTLNKEGWTLVRFTINSNGTVAGMHLDASSRDSAIDRAAWGGITGVGQFPPLPKEFTGPQPGVAHSLRDLAEPAQERLLGAKGCRVGFRELRPRIPSRPQPEAYVRERRAQLRGLLVLAALILLWILYRANRHAIFHPGWWRL